MPEDPEDPEDDDVPSEEDSEEEEESEEEEDSEEDEEESEEDEEDSEGEEEDSEGEEEDSEEEEEDSEEEEEDEEDEEETVDEEVDDSAEDDDEEEEEDSEEEEAAEEADAAGDEADEIVLPDLDEEVFGSRDEWDADDEDFEDDQGDWSADDYHEVASTLFGDHGFFGDTAVQRYIDEGFTPLEEDDHEVVRGVREHLPDATTIRFFERDGRIVPRGFLTSTALELLEAAFPDLHLDFLRVTIPKRPRPAPPEEPPRGLPPQIANVAPRDSIDLRKYATPVGDQGSTSRCAAFAWTHALEMLGNMHQRPFPRLACSFTMYRFQERQGDRRDFRYAWKGGDGTTGTWEPGAHLFVKGTCRHDHWPNEHKEPLVALEEMEADAQSHTFEADIYDVTLDEMKKLLSAGLPVQISMATGDAFQDIGRDGVMKVAEAPKGQHGYHAMLCVGYVGNYFIVKNSWGDDWGDNGYCYIPKKVLAESEPEAVAIVPRGRMAPPNMPPPNMTPGGGGPPTGAGARGGGGTMMMSAIPMPPPASRARPGTQAIPAMPAAPPVAQAPVPSLMTCARCAKHVPRGKFCRECGAPLPAPAPPPSTRSFCSNCGARREGAGRFCAGCGAKHE